MVYSLERVFGRYDGCDRSCHCGIQQKPEAQRHRLSGVEQAFPVKPMTREELLLAISETERQEKLFRLADDTLRTAHWILERVKLRAQLFYLIQKETFR